MKTAIFYSSRKGSTAFIAERIRKELGEDHCDIFFTKAAMNTDLSAYDTVIIGTPIYAGKPMPECVKFCQMHEQTLLTKHLGLYICGMNEAVLEQELQSAFPATLFAHAHCKKAMGGAFDFSKMNFMERIIVRKLAKVKDSVEQFREDSLAEFIETMRLQTA